MTSPGSIAVLAFGGNALLPDPFHPEEQEERAAELASAVLLLLEKHHGIVLVHGNGPQVGMILLRVEATRDRYPSEPLDVLVAETQGSVGILLSRALHNALRGQGSDVEVTSILTQVVVDPQDPAFSRPDKPVGPSYPALEARYLRDERGWTMVEDRSGRWRRVVPSPRPEQVIEFKAIRAAAQAGQVVIAGGGGGVPVCRTGTGLAGVEAVIDKDRTSAHLACQIEAQSYILLTGMPHVLRGFGTPRAEILERLSVKGARKLADEGEFPPGSMGPKIEAACSYVEKTGHKALITDAASLGAALAGEAGTWIVP